jgi:sugar lactone lactonase YvrE
MKKSSLLLFLTIILFSTCKENHPYAVVTTFAGSGKMGVQNGKETSASFANMMGIATDTAGNIYVADSHNNLIRKISPDGTVTTLAGSGAVGNTDGKGTSASFFNPQAIAVDKDGNVYVADTHNNLIRKITPDGIVTTIAGQQRDSAIKLDNPSGIAVDNKGNIYVSDWANDLIRKITPDGKITTLAGNRAPGSKDGKDTAASFYLPAGLAVDAAGNIYVADSYNNMIRKITPTGVVTTLAGKTKKGFVNGKDTAALFSHPEGVAVDNNGNVYVADMQNNCIRKISPDGMVTTLAGNGKRGSQNGRDTTANFFKPYDVAVGKDGAIYVADYQNNLIRKITFK